MQDWTSKQNVETQPTVIDWLIDWLHFYVLLQKKNHAFQEENIWPIEQIQTCFVLVRHEMLFW